MKTKEETKNNNFTHSTRTGISLIVLVITIIVIIILAAAVIVTLTNNNPVKEANTARYESDRANMQAVFTNTVAKVMAKNQATVKISAGQINYMTSGEKDSYGEVYYTLIDAQNIENSYGTIIFDKGDNTDTTFYTGKKLPIYSADETMWFVDEEGTISLKVGKKIYGIKLESGVLIDGYDFNSNIPYEVNSIAFTDEVAPSSVELIDVSIAQDNSIVMWTEGNKMKVSTQRAGVKIIAPKDSSGMFSFAENVQEIDLSNLDTSKVEDMHYMFQDCKSLVKINLSSFDTSNVKDFGAMFTGCESLPKLDLSNFNTQNIEDFRYMFNDCYSLTDLNISTFVTNKSVDMTGMFHGCRSIETLDLRHFNTNNVEEMNYMFYDCYALKNLDVSSFNTSKVFSMYAMFENCQSLQELNLSHFDTKNVNDMGYMFYKSKIKKLNLSSFIISDNCYTDYMFNDCIELEEIILGKGFVFKDTNSYLPIPTDDRTWYNTSKQGFEPSEIPSNVADTYTCNPPWMTGIIKSELYRNLPVGTTSVIFTDISAPADVEVIDVSHIKDNSIVGWSIGTTFYISNQNIGSKINCYSNSLNEMFYGVNGDSTIESIDFGNLNTSGATTMNSMIYYCKNLQSIDLSKLDTSNITDMSWLFFLCENLTDINFGDDFNTSNVTNMEYMFSSCKKLESLDLNFFDTSNVTNMNSMFSNCSNLKSINISRFNTEKVTNMSYLFKNCYALESIDVTSFNTKNVIRMDSMFQECTTLSNLDLSSFDTSSLTKTPLMFYECINLEKIYVSSLWDISSITKANSKNMFYNCTKLSGKKAYNKQYVDKYYANINGYMTLK